MVGRSIDSVVVVDASPQLCFGEGEVEVSSDGVCLVSFVCGSDGLVPFSRSGGRRVSQGLEVPLDVSEAVSEVAAVSAVLVE